MQNKELVKLNFDHLLKYNIDGYHKNLEIKCNGFCTACEERRIVPDGCLLETISHAADSDDYFRQTSIKYRNNKPIMFVFENPGGNVNYEMGRFYECNGFSKYIPIYSYYWIDSKAEKAPETIDDLIKYGNLYGSYLLYIINRYSLNNVYITNLTKCKLNNNYEYSRIRENCINEIFVKELELFKPELIIFFGNAAYNYFHWEGLSKYHGIDKTKLKHPAARMNHKDIVIENNKILDGIFV
jgi:hypothetical protein